jgi:branched-chain amino acid transport system ATP-binding protein
MDAVLGASIGEFVGLTLVLFGGAGFLMGQALAQTWQPAWHAAPYALLMAVANRFLAYALFGGNLTAILPFAFDAVVVLALALFAFGLTRARAMTRQYPWLYEPDGLFGWRDRSAAVGASDAGIPDRRGL